VAAGIQRMVVAILKQDRQIVIEHAGDWVLTCKGATKNLEPSLSGRCGRSARREWGYAQRRAGDTEGGEYCGAGSLGDSNRNRLQLAPLVRDLTSIGPATAGRLRRNLAAKNAQNRPLQNLGRAHVSTRRRLTPRGKPRVIVRAAVRALTITSPQRRERARGQRASHANGVRLA
jgi:hypothetical protein